MFGHIGQDGAQRLFRLVQIVAGRHRNRGRGDAGFAQRVDRETGAERLALRAPGHRAAKRRLERTSDEHFQRRKIRAVRCPATAWRASWRRPGCSLVHMDGRQIHRTEIECRTLRGKVLDLMRAEQGLDLGQRGCGIDIARHHQHGIVGRVPGVVEFLQHVGVGLVECRLRAQRVMLIGRAAEQSGAQAADT